MTAHSELMKPLDPDQLEREKDEWIKAEVEFLLSPGQKCDPLKADNIVEAIAQMDDANLELFRFYFSDAQKEGITENTFHHSVLTDFLIYNNRKYWKEMAEFLANKEWDEKIS